MSPRSTVLPPALAGVAGLARASHPGPVVAVTAGITALALALGVRSALGVSVAVLLGQVSVGWSNDAIDAAADRAACRWDKPTVSGRVTPATLWVLAGVAAVACLPASMAAAGPAGGACHAAAVAMAWAYNLRLKRTRWSFLPYAVSFGLVGPFLGMARPVPAPGPGWLAACLAALGVAAHLANGIPDIDTDRRTGTGGAVARLGVRRSALLSRALLLTAAAAAMVASPLALPWAMAGVLALGLALWVPVVLPGGARHLFTVLLLLAVVAAGALAAYRPQAGG